MLDHIPKAGSIQINKFSETTSINLVANQFRCLYSESTNYREANRIIHFHAANEGKTITVSYVAVGTPITADDLNEIKTHLENQALHNSAYTLPTASATTKGGIKVGSGLKMTGEVLNVVLGTTPLTVEGGMWLSVEGG